MKPKRWSHETTQELVHFVKDNPCLYNLNSTGYLSVKKKEQAWNKILQQLRRMDPSLNMTEIKRKWRNLRVQFTQEIRRINLANENSYEYIPKLWCYNQLRFLAAHIIARKLGDSECEEEEITKNDDESSMEVSYINEISESDKRTQDQKVVGKKQIKPDPNVQNFQHDDENSADVTYANEILENSISAEVLCNVKSTRTNQTTTSANDDDSSPDVSYLNEHTENDNSAEEGFATIYRYKGKPLIVDKIWTTESIEALIKLLKKHENLYNVNIPLYTHSDMRKYSLSTICNELKKYNEEITVDEVKKQIQNLRKQYSKELCDIEVAKRMGKGNLSSKWWCFNKLHFLGPYTVVKIPSFAVSHHSPPVSVHSDNSDGDENPLNEYVVYEETFDVNSEDDANDEHNANTRYIDENIEVIYGEPESQPANKKKRVINRADGLRRSEVSRSNIKTRKIAVNQNQLNKKPQKNTNYDWLGKQVSFEISSMKDEQIRRDTVWGIQKLLYEAFQKDRQEIYSDPLNASRAEDENSCT
ncbi:uncharacterized protein [Musca autumnalis]|uniref:uncharacterized protein n=1 Tax=Musca autumnalis TaxID=221902 RepID=UPI003CEA4967